MTCLSSGEGREGGQRGLALASFVAGGALPELQDGEVLAAAGGVAVDVAQPAGHAVLDQAQDAGFGRNAHQVHVLLAGPDDGLQDRVPAVRDRGDRITGSSGCALPR